MMTFLQSKDPKEANIFKGMPFRRSSFKEIDANLAELIDKNKKILLDQLGI